MERKKFQTTAGDPGDQIFCQNRSILHRFQDNHVLNFTENFKMAAQNGGKTILCKNWHTSLWITPGVKNFVKNRSHTVSEINADVFLLHVTQNFKMATKNIGKIDIWQKVTDDSADTLGV